MYFASSASACKFIGCQYCLDGAGGTTIAIIQKKTFRIEDQPRRTYLRYIEVILIGACHDKAKRCTTKKTIIWSGRLLLVQF
jgi:hypothetical protein